MAGYPKIEQSLKSPKLFRISWFWKKAPKNCKKYRVLEWMQFCNFNKSGAWTLIPLNFFVWAMIYWVLILLYGNSKKTVSEPLPQQFVHTADITEILNIFDHELQSKLRACTNYEERILGIFDLLSPLCDHLSIPLPHVCPRGLYTQCSIGSGLDRHPFLKSP